MLEKLLGEMRPRLHRYCARMSGSVIDGEDIVQDALAKAYAARASFGGLDNPQAWLYRIAHNAALDFLRRRARMPPMEDEDELAVEFADGQVIGIRDFLYARYAMEGLEITPLGSTGACPTGPAR
ncbi:hypothetical protein RugamoR57_51630 [Duganella caerulea]